MKQYHRNELSSFKLITEHNAANVYTALDNDETVVVKVPNGKFGAVREAQIMIDIGVHPHIVHLKGLIGTDPHCMILKYMSLGDFGRYLCNNNWSGVAAQQAEVRNNIVYQAICGLLFIHQRGYVHRDIKPANIFLNRTPEGDISAVIGDLADARKIDPVTQRYISPLPHPVGTCGFIAPESYFLNKEGRTEYTLKADIFSMAIVILAAGSDAMNQYSPPTIIPTEVTAETRETFLLCYEKDPEKRISTQQLKDRYDQMRATCKSGKLRQ